MGDTISIVLAAAISSLVSSGVVTAIVQQFWKGLQDERLERVKSEFTRQNEMLRIEQERLTSTVQTRFTWLHERRAKAMLDIYALIVKVANAHAELLVTLDFNVAKANERHDELMNCYFELRDYYRPIRLLFPDDVVQQLDALSEAFYSSGVESMETESSQAVLEMLRPQLDSLRQLEDNIVKDFRQLYGVEPRIRHSGEAG